jgi:hypothetical protein
MVLSEEMNEFRCVTDTLSSVQMIRGDTGLSTGHKQTSTTAHFAVCSIDKCPCALNGTHRTLQNFQYEKFFDTSALPRGVFQFYSLKELKTKAFKLMPQMMLQM